VRQRLLQHCLRKLWALHCLQQECLLLLLLLLLLQPLLRQPHCQLHHRLQHRLQHHLLLLLQWSPAVCCGLE
jgi:hypothetical protein